MLSTRLGQGGGRLALGTGLSHIGRTGVGVAACACLAFPGFVAAAAYEGMASLSTVTCISVRVGLEGLGGGAEGTLPFPLDLPA